MQSKKALQIKRLLSNKNDRDNDLDELVSKFYKFQFILVSGRAGTGKSVLLQKLKSALLNYNFKVVVAAPTGVAAVNVGGTTLHSWLGMGLASDDINILFDKLTHRAKSVLKCTDVLLIDEISMVEPEFFEKISMLSQYVNKSKIPFGRIRIVMFGDFLQLPPVSVNEKTRFVFQTKLWSNMNVYRVHLRKVYRQKDNIFLNLLNEIRNGIISSSTNDILVSRCLAPPEPYTRLCTYRNKVNSFNQNKMQNLPGEQSTYTGYFSTKRQHENINMTPADLKLADTVIALSDRYFPIAIKLYLKPSSQVMMRCNTYMDLNICNGSIGNVVQLGKNKIVVNFAGQHVTVGRYQFIYQCGQTVNLCFYQFPLSVSYAMTIHKSQGLTIDRVLVDTDCFETGQIYTAFSRVRCLTDLFITSINQAGLKVDPSALLFES
jgi:ATP-dependent DNA helicase PIF1